MTDSRISLSESSSREGRLRPRKAVEGKGMEGRGTETRGEEREGESSQDRECILCGRRRGKTRDRPTVAAADSHTCTDGKRVREGEEEERKRNGG